MISESEQQLKAVLREKEEIIKNLNKTIVGLQISKNKFYLLQRTIQDMNASDEPATICRYALDFIIQIINYFYLELIIFQGELHEVRGELPAGVPAESQFDISTLNWAIESNHVVFSSLLNPPDEEESAAPKTLKRGEFFILVPVSYASEALGYLKVHPTKKEDNITQDEISFLQIIANNLAYALHSSQLKRHTIYLKNFYNWIINSMSFGVLVVSRQEEISYMNKNAEFMLGVSLLLEHPMHYKTLFSDRLRRIFSDVILRTYANGPILDYEYEHVLGEGVTVPLGISTSLMRSNEGVEDGLVVIIRDLTLTREISKLQELDKLRSDFIHAATHEFRNPLSSIMLLTDSLLQHLASQRINRKRIQEQVKGIEEQSKSLNDLVTDVLDIGKMENQGIQFFNEFMNVRDLMKGTAKGLRAFARKRGIRIHIRAQDNLMIFNDRKQLMRVLNNLLSNAIKYSRENSAVEFRAEEIPGYIRFVVRDTGIGIKPEGLERIFEKFYRVPESDTDSVRGHGLGLSIVKRIVDASHGKIAIESEFGKGSTFTVDFPREDYTDMVTIIPDFDSQELLSGNDLVSDSDELFESLDT